MKNNPYLFISKKIIFCFIFGSLFFLFDVPNVSAAAVLSPQYGSSPPANYARVPDQSLCGTWGTCWNSASVGSTDCGTACSGGNAWTKYDYSGCYYDLIDFLMLNVLPFYVISSNTYSTGDKYNSSNTPVMNAGNCNLNVGGPYKTCCLGTTPVSARNLCSAGSPLCDPYDPPEADCGGYTTVRCGGGGEPACGQAACNTLAPPPTCNESCTSWTNSECGNGSNGCSVGQMKQTRSCSSGASCDTFKCVTDGACAPPPPPPSCPATGDNCVFSQDGACYSGKANNLNTCTWVNGTCLNPTSGCTYSCGPVSCPAGTAPTPPPAPTPIPPPGNWQACGSCAVGCGGDNAKSHCFSGGTDQGCQPSYQCRISPDNTCQWDPGACNSPSGGGMTCLDCGFGMARFCQPSASLITWEDLSNTPNICSNGWAGYAWGPKARIIQQNLNDSGWCNADRTFCAPSGSWGGSSVGLESCICGNSTADTTITFSNSNPRPGETFTIYAKSYKNYDQGSGSGAALDPMVVRMTAYDSTGRMINLGAPARKSTAYITSYNVGECHADTWTGSGDGKPWPQRVYEWDTSLPTTGTYSFKLSVQEQYYVCATASLTITTPPAPAVPTLNSVTCLTGRTTSLSWNTVSGASVYELKVYRAGYSSINPLIYANWTSSPATYTFSDPDQFWWQVRAGNQYGSWSAWSSYGYFNCTEPMKAWIQTTGDIHSNSQISAPGGP